MRSTGWSALLLLAAVACGRVAAGSGSSTTTAMRDPAHRAAAPAAATATFAPADEAPPPERPPPPRADPATPLNMSGAKERSMANCPSAVPDARTAVLFTDDGVELVITAGAAASQQRIRALARRQLALDDPTGRALHSGGHGGPAGIGYCPVVHLPGTHLTSRDVPGGVRLRVHASGEDAIVDLQILVAHRVAGLPLVQPMPAAR